MEASACAAVAAGTRRALSRVAPRSPCGQARGGISMIAKVRITALAKAPRPGAVKTRLIDELGPQGAAALARRMLQATLAAAIGARLGPVELCMSPDPGTADWQ